ncbi:MAG: MaoC family dehydratase N-terminal domain-containing protein [Actinobacteria bacterium]|nr:MaoC family dehydratase N-terminal domain-containing protein [Actinomycetota bacterium]
MAEGRRSAAAVGIGDRIGPRGFELDRARLVRYAGAALDFNSIHWSDQAAERAGLPEVIAHGMLTMALAGRLVTDWAGDPGAVEDFSTRFSGMVPVGVEGPAMVVVEGTVTELLDGGRVVVELTVEAGRSAVLKAARAVVNLAPSSPGI